MKYLVLLLICFVGFALMRTTSADDCPRVCTMEYNPQCVQDASGKTYTFGNPCEFRTRTCSEPNAGYVLLRSGEC